jgi:hypothetical protein
MDRKEIHILSSSRMLSIAVLTLILSGAIACTDSLPPETSSDAQPVLGIEELSRLDLLPRLKQSAKVGMVSSHDRTGGNDDGFSGAYSFIRKEEAGLVLADLEGPGIIYRIHIPVPADDVIEFYFDGETSPRISLNITELFTGKHAPFLSPLVGTGAGGRYCYVPLTFQHSCKVLARAETFHFYQICYAQYPEDFVIPTYEDPPSEAFLSLLEDAKSLICSAGSDISSYLVPEGTRMKVHYVRKTLQSEQTVTMFHTKSPGRIVGLKLGPAKVFAGKDRDILIKMYWDGYDEPAVASPVGDIFGYSFGEPAVRSLLAGTSGETNYMYFPMPFERSARIVLVSERTSGPAVEVWAEVTVAALGKAEDEGRFYARWRRENPTQEGTPYTFLQTTGRGHVVGIMLQAQGIEIGHTGFFEGDERVVIDGKLAIPGTGSEETFNGGWYDVPGRWESRVSFPLSGCLDYKKHLSRTGGYRWLITDAWAFDQSIDFTIEHGPEGNKMPTDYTSVTYFYSSDPPQNSDPLPPAAKRRVTNPLRIVFVPGWNVPIHTTSLQNAIWSKRTETIGENRVRYLSMKTAGEDIFDPHHISFICDMPNAGNYNVGIKAVRGPDQGIVQMFQHDRPVGEAVNLYAPDRNLSPVLPLGVQEMSYGDNLFFLHLVGQDVRSAGIGLDLVEVIFERID